jgi:hypothetical protein
MLTAMTPKSACIGMLFAKYLLANDMSLETSLVTSVLNPKLTKMLKIAVNATAKFQMPKPSTPRYLANRIR